MSLRHAVAMNASMKVFNRCVAMSWQNAGYLLSHVTLKHTFSYPTYTYSDTLHTCRLICSCMHSHTLHTHILIPYIPADPSAAALILTPYIHIFSHPTYTYSHTLHTHILTTYIPADTSAAAALGAVDGFKRSRCVCVAVCVAVCCSVLQGVCVCCSVLQCVAGCCRVLQGVAVCCS